MQEEEEIRARWWYTTYLICWNSGVCGPNQMHMLNGPGAQERGQQVCSSVQKRFVKHLEWKVDAQKCQYQRGLREECAGAMGTHSKVPGSPASARKLPGGCDAWSEHWRIMACCWCKVGVLGDKAGEADKGQAMETWSVMLGTWNLVRSYYVAIGMFNQSTDTVKCLTTLGGRVRQR